MRIIDKNTDFYDFYQNIYRDNSVTFDRTDSFLLTKEIMCEYLSVRRYKFLDRLEPINFVLLQVCHTFWLFMVEITAEKSGWMPTEYKIELLKTWKNYHKQRRMIALDIIDFNYDADRLIHQDKYWSRYDKAKIVRRADTLAELIDRNDFKIRESIDCHIICKSGKDDEIIRIEKHIPLLKACGIAELVDPLEIYIAFEEYFSLEKSSEERTESNGLANDEKIGNHGFDLKKSFRGKP